MATRLHLVRHGHTDALGHTLTGRTPGIGLSAKGLEQARAAARALRGCPVSAILSSPQRRARQTADAISAETGLPVETEAALDEVDFGAWTGQTFKALGPALGWAEWNSLRSLAPTPGGETMLQVQVRAISLMQRLRTREPDSTLVLVSHADVIRSMLAYLLGLPIDLMLRIELSPAARSVVTLYDSDIRIEAINLPPLVG